MQHFPRARHGADTLGEVVGSRVLALLALVLVSTAATYAKGVDVSNYQGSIDWLQVAGDGYSFAFAKASEGFTFTDVTYALNRTGAPGVGLRLGAYHFARPSGTSDATITTSAIGQADHFVDVAQPKAGDLPPVVDLETTGGLKPTALVKWTQAWLDEVNARTGLSALIYASPSFWQRSLSDTTAFALAGHRLWIAHWTKSSSPLVPAADWNGGGWSFWQWSNCQKVAGITSKCVDGDRANAADPSRYALTAYPGGAPSAATPPTVVGTARAGAKLAAVPGTWTGAKPVSFTYQWQRCDAAGAGCAPIPGATLETYTASTADIGHALVASVTATAKAGAASASSTPTGAVAAANGVSVPAALAQPQVTGTMEVGQTLTASVGTWSGSPTGFGYQWQRCDAAGANCVPIPDATASTYVLSPGDVGATVVLAVAARNSAGSTTATAPVGAAVAAAAVPPAVPGSLAAVAGVAGAVAAEDGSATVTWQPGAVPLATTVSLASAPPVLTLALDPAVKTLPWPVDIAYPSAPAGQVVGFSTDGRIWRPVTALTSPTLPAGVVEGAWNDGTAQHVLTRKAGQFRLFVTMAWGDPTRISRFAPRIRRVAPVHVRRLRSGAFVVSTRLSVPSQALIVPSKRRVLRPGAFPFKVRVAKTSRSVRVTALDPYGRRGHFTLSFSAP
jgi:GH25 family lysozyme M1 (1,4-beta-N-acetylmuramidase)